MSASHWQSNHTAILSPRDMPAFMRTLQTDTNSNPVMPPSGRHVSTPYLSLPKSVFSNTQLAILHIHTQTHAHTLNYAQNPLCLLTDKNYRLSDFTDSISNPWQLTDSPPWAGCWQGTHGLFTNQRGFAEHIMEVMWTTLKFIWIYCDIKGSLIESLD